ncbi:MAG: prolipoprotein diacylglyceryl transferase [Planctomycetes bacterium]|nr:prolipoprotein diacylglyceryl transferase [Planctomycetota bacterium]
MFPKFQIGPVSLYGYGIMLGLSCVLGAHLASYLCVRSGISSKKAWKIILTVIVAGIVGGRIHELIVTGQPLSKLFELQHSGRTAYGAFLIATLFGVLACKGLRVPFWRFADAAAPTMALGLGITRIGCFLAGCDYGLRSESLGVTFPAGSPAWSDQIRAGDLTMDAARSLPVMPTQLLSSLAGLAIFALCMKLWFRRPRREGDVTLLFFGSYGLARAGLELLRGDRGRGELGGMSTSTTIGLASAAIALGLVLIPVLRKFRAEAGEILPHEPDEPKPAVEGES